MVTSVPVAVACSDPRIDFPSSGLASRDSIVHAVIVHPDSATVNIGSQLVLAASVDAGAMVVDRSVLWSSSNSNIAPVNAAGIVTATTPGVATITVRSKADTSVKDTSVITVAAPVSSPMTP